jgi:hypothetical protein
MLPLLVVLGSIVFCEACGVYDVMMTEKGLRAGVAVEGNTWLVGEKPTAMALYLRDNLSLVLSSLPAIVMLFLHNTPLAYGCSAAPVAYGVKHIIGARKWAKLLKK